MGNTIKQKYLIDISDLNTIDLIFDPIKKPCQMVSILVIGQASSGKSSFLNYLMTQVGLKKLCEVTSEGKGTQNIQCHLNQIKIEDINLMLIDTQCLEYDPSTSNQKKEQAYFQLLIKILQMTTFVFFIQHGNRNFIHFQNFLKELKSKQIKLPQIFYVKNKLRKDEITSSQYIQDEQYKMLYSPFNQTTGEIEQVLKKVNNFIEKEFDFKKILKKKKYQQINEEEFLTYLLDTVSDWNKQRREQDAEVLEPIQKKNQPDKKKSKNLCTFQQDENGNCKLVYDKELFDEVLKNKVCCEKVKTVICCGNTGVGKSFFLTELCKQFGQDDLIFDYECSSQQKTIGIHYHRFKDKDNYDIFLMDCQGFDYYDEKLNDAQQIMLQQQLKFLISLFSKGFEYFIFMQTEIRDCKQFYHIKTLMDESAINFLKPEIFIIKNKLNKKETQNFKSQSSENINKDENKQFFPLIFLEDDDKDSRKTFNEQMEKIQKSLKNEKETQNSFYSFYEVIEYIQLSITIFNNGIDNQLENILKILKLRFQYNEYIRRENNKFLQNMKECLDKQIKNYQKQYSTFFYCSQNILYQSFQDQQIELIKKDYIKYKNEWDAKLNQLLLTLQFQDEDSKNQILQKYAQLEKIAPELIQAIKKYETDKDYNQLKLIFTSIVTGIATASILVGAISLGSSAAVLATAEVTTATLVTAVGLSGLAITLGASAGALITVGGLSIGIKKYKDYNKNKVLKEKSLKLLENLKQEKIIFQQGEYKQKDNLLECITKNYKQNDQLMNFCQNKKDDEMFFGLLLITFMLLDFSLVDFKKVEKIEKNLKDKEKELISVHKKVDQMLSELGKDNAQNLWEIHFEKLYSMDFSDIKSKKNYTIDKNDEGIVHINSQKCSYNFNQIPNYTNQHVMATVGCAIQGQEVYDSFLSYD
ncbi:transmembrane protein, putative (macronuclear) [Tetrahymena thermophila SB210]|uniref:Transmembrane protein, putative n=1 Tax=Tetrahymena thermophila (strain SB210) TaxID=312017 RepID=W7XIX9_TETTS|nr:transmembrane protein, putative [Tetrahymena thermophila SB210]EWS73689.1 transmembrane protein, putative [Tetrahymena thermophila SB210]|eukprot:XP_012653727.1 transmembrane protein, putative [Tetrahymena thermophila SB210]